VKAGGEIGRRIDLTIQKNLLAIDVDNQFLAPFRRKQSRLFDYIGLGKLIDATVAFAYYTGDPKVVALKDHLVKELIATQLDDGYIGAFPSGARLRDVFDEHEIAYNIHALVNNYRRFHDQPSLDAARRLADYLIKNYKSATATRDPQLVCKVDIQRAMIALGEATGDARYRDYILERDGLRGWHSPIDVVNAGQYSSGDGHAYTFMNTALAQLDLYRQQPDASLLGQSHRVIDYLTKDDGLMITGTCSLTKGSATTRKLSATWERVAPRPISFACSTIFCSWRATRSTATSWNGQSIARCLRRSRRRPQLALLHGHRRPSQVPSRRYVLLSRQLAANRGGTAGNDLLPLSRPRGACESLHGLDGGSADRRRPRRAAATGDDYPNSGKVVIAVDPTRSAEFLSCCAFRAGAHGRGFRQRPTGRRPGQARRLVLDQAAMELRRRGDAEMPMKPRLVRGRSCRRARWP